MLPLTSPVSSEARFLRVSKLPAFKLSPNLSAHAPAKSPLRIVHLNSMLSGGGTDDQCVKLAYGLPQMRHQAWIAGPDGRAFSGLIRNLVVPFHFTPREGSGKLKLVFHLGKFIQREHMDIVNAHHGRALW